MKFFAIYVLWVISLVTYIWICSLATNTQDQFLFAVTFGTMCIMMFFCAWLAFATGTLED
ncbi:MAG: hypothetical protein ACFFD7_13060 [Candidatus Thorarchaeota archaeon]